MCVDKLYSMLATADTYVCKYYEIKLTGRVIENLVNDMHLYVCTYCIYVCTVSTVYMYVNIVNLYVQLYIVYICMYILYICMYMSMYSMLSMYIYCVRTVCP